MTNWTPNKLRDFFSHYDFANPNHQRAVDMLQRQAGALMSDNAEWVKAFRSGTEDPAYLFTAAEIIKEFEGFSTTPYKCSAGVWTIGFGNTYYPDGTLVQPGDRPISKETAVKILENHIDNVIVPTLRKTIPTWEIMGANQKAAIISFAYNLGSNFYGTSGFDTITRALSKKENFPQVPAALTLYVNPGSTFERGLRRRRKSEGDLWTKPVT